MGLDYPLKEKVPWKPGFRRWFPSSSARGRLEEEGRQGELLTCGPVLLAKERGESARPARLGLQRAGPRRGTKAERGGGEGMLGRGRGRKLGRAAAAALAFLFFFFFFVF